MAVQGRKSWSVALWRRYVGAAKSAEEKARRIALARVEAPADFVATLDQLELPKPAPVTDPKPAGSDAEGSWWW